MKFKDVSVNLSWVADKTNLIIIKIGNSDLYTADN